MKEQGRMAEAKYWKWLLADDTGVTELAHLLIATCGLSSTEQEELAWSLLAIIGSLKSSVARRSVLYGTLWRQCPMELQMPRHGNAVAYSISASSAGVEVDHENLHVKGSGGGQHVEWAFLESLLVQLDSCWFGASHGEGNGLVERHLNLCSLSLHMASLKASTTGFKLRSKSTAAVNPGPGVSPGGGDAQACVADVQRQGEAFHTCILHGPSALYQVCIAQERVDESVAYRIARQAKREMLLIIITTSPAQRKVRTELRSFKRPRNQ
ncbi:uncharacterized protein MYCFIDRAFT_171235 [Pseudocercospora fijiensis CIRAD86]|uniref:Uncharacterized protein n=1 Tax=Pseudocercospora fijiensis (strain CIRAD86) TaxID=383855 RepID=M3AL57_PSEFD|nr:uncharacterized protein MYCFIDRAFT_171235 [Pseudocercospora fijiensis CIRAD86]EME85296.1 hypothetical protein MYCFIDRAFT_171235 [Pseudocercospora fijiensis CIRAD86]